MKKAIIIGMLGISMLGLTACGSNSAKSNNASSQSSKKVESQNTIKNDKNNGLTISTKYGKISFQDAFAGINNDPSGTHVAAMSMSYKVTNTSHNPMTAEQILDGVLIDFINVGKNTEKPLDHTDGVEQIFNDDDTDGYNKMIDASHEWTNTKIRPGKSMKVVDPYLYSISSPKDMQKGYIQISGPNTKETKIDVNSARYAGKYYKNADKYVDSLIK